MAEQGPQRGIVEGEKLLRTIKGSCEESGLLTSWKGMTYRRRNSTITDRNLIWPLLLARQLFISLCEFNKFNLKKRERE